MSPGPTNAVRHDQAVRVNLTMHVTRIGFGIFSFDPVEQMIGAPLASLLESLMVAPMSRRPSLAGPAVEVYPLALPPGEGATIPLGHLGEIGFANDDGLLVLTVPWGMAGWLREKLGDAIVRGLEAGLRLDGTARVAQAWVRLRAGMRASFPLGGLGEVEVGVEAAKPSRQEPKRRRNPVVTRRDHGPGRDSRIGRDWHPPPAR